MRKHARVANVTHRALEALERERVGGARQVSLQLARRLDCAQVSDRHDHF